MRYVHSFVKMWNEQGDCLGWRTPLEVGVATPQNVSIVIPSDNGLDDRYSCEVLKLNDPNLLVYDMVRTGEDSFTLTIGDAEVRFSRSKEETMPYTGKLGHADFAVLANFAEIIPDDPSVLDQIYNDKDLVIVGCYPFNHYSGIPEHNRSSGKILDSR